MDMLAGRMHLTQEGLKVVFNVFSKKGILLPGVTIPNMKKINEEKKRAKAERRRAQASGSATASTSTSAAAPAPAKRGRKGRK